jgi:hypothetical protein
MWVPLEQTATSNGGLDLLTGGLAELQRAGKWVTLYEMDRSYGRDLSLHCHRNLGSEAPSSLRSLSMS